MKIEGQYALRLQKKSMLKLHEVMGGWGGNQNKDLSVEALCVGETSLQRCGPSDWAWLEFEIKQKHWSIPKKKVYFVPI